LTPFSVLTGVALMLGYCLLGAGWLILKTEGDLQAWARRMGRVCFVGVLAAIGIVSIWTPIMQPAIAQRWFSWPDIGYLVPVDHHAGHRGTRVAVAQPRRPCRAVHRRDGPLPHVVHRHRH